MTNQLVEAVQGSTSEVLQKQLIEVVQSAIDTGKNVADFAVEQAPLLVNEIINYSIFECGFYVVSGLVLGLITCKFTKFICRKYRELNEVDDESYIPVVIIGVVGISIMLIASIALVFDNIMPMIKAIVAPRLFLIEYLSNLLK